ncbi:MAG TPA: lysylphosphatidylglycerol synthase transmembrane domain-containing protein [Candidatus Thermoplasmatota archaeon]|nr:lysylphosphatidylglycerol synthase transmembrane domain-containing protein [Candidatus Thermoplasmatota archaeon]
MEGPGLLPEPATAARTAAAAPERQASRLRRLVPAAVAVSVGTIIVLSVVHNARGGNVLATLRLFDVRLLPLLLGLHLLMQVWWALRFRLLARPLGCDVGFPRAQAAVTSGLFAAAVTPGRVGGEPWRIAYLYRSGASPAAASRTILADRSVDILFFVALGLLVVLALPRLFGSEGREVRALAVLALSGLLAILAFLVLALAKPRPLAAAGGAVASAWDRLLRREPKDRSGKLEAFFSEVRSGLAALARTGKRRLALALVLSLLLWTTEFAVLHFTLQGFGHDVPFVAVYAAGVLVTMVASVPLLPGGSGVAEITALAVLTPLAPGLTPAFLVVWRGTTYYQDLLVGGVVTAATLRRGARRRKPSRAR